jgi:hypothetical protein
MPEALQDTCQQVVHTSRCRPWRSVQGRRNQTCCLTPDIAALHKAIQRLHSVAGILFIQVPTHFLGDNVCKSRFGFGVTV